VRWHTNAECLLPVSGAFTAHSQLALLEPGGLDSGSSRERDHVTFVSYTDSIVQSSVYRRAHDEILFYTRVDLGGVFL
jgi:hypothetical protein